jgi:hypothetical protein
MAFYQTRSVAYEASKTIGDISSVTGGSSGQPFRSALLNVGKKLGDVNSAMGAPKIAQAGGGVQGRITSRVFGAGARASGLTNLNSLPPVARRAIQRSVGAEMQRFRSHGWRSAGTTPSGAGRVVTKHKLAKTLEFGIGIKAFAEINYVDENAFLEMILSPRMEDLMMDAGNKILQDIRKTAPVDTGKYQNSFTINKITAFGVPVVVIETNDFGKGKWLEYGTIKMGPRPTIRNAFLRAAGQSAMPEYTPLKNRKQK